MGHSHKTSVVPVWFWTSWLANEVGDTIAFTKLFKIRVVDCAILNLNEKVNNSSKALYNRNFKTLRC